MGAQGAGEIVEQVGALDRSLTASPRKCIRRQSLPDDAPGGRRQKIPGGLREQAAYHSREQVSTPTARQYRPAKIGVVERP